jgi:hypothetical protein
VVGGCKKGYPYTCTLMVLWGGWWLQKRVSLHLYFDGIVRLEGVLGVLVVGW